jgi:SPP1 gp7 family putative phage head morphogenesis protein
MSKKKLLNPPDQAEREYTRLLTGFVRELRRDINQVMPEAIRASKAEFDTAIRADAWGDALTAALLELARLAAGKTDAVVARLPGMYQLINRHNDRQFRMVVRANTGVTLPDAVPFRGLGVDIFRGEPFLRPLYEGWIDENTKLVKSIHEQYHSQLGDELRRGIMAGDSVKTLAGKLSERFGITDRRAKLIATDQTLNAHAELTRYRMQSVGVKEYIWRTVQDSRVRPEHAEREGKKFSWDKPPDGGHPGQAVRCRCGSEPIFPEDGD